jgi:hypothetical protein
MLKVKIVTMKQIAACPTMNLSAEHWVGGHRIEECHDDLKKEVVKFETKVAQEKAKKIAKVRADGDKKIEEFKKNLRKGRRGRAS